MADETNLFAAERLISSSRRSTHELADLATSQHGIVARRQLLELGFSSGQIQRMRASKRLHGVHQGVYAVGHRSLRREAKRSRLEEHALVALDGAGVPRPAVNVRLVCRPGAGWEVDFLWRRQRIVLETDGGRFHSTRGQIERDRRKEADLVIAGYRVLRATWLQVEREPDVVARMVRAAMAACQ